MRSRDAGTAAGSATEPRVTMRELIFGRRYGVHRLIAFCLVVALVAVIASLVVQSRASGLDRLPGVARVDERQHVVELAGEVTPAQAREIFDRAREQDAPWTLLLGPARLTTAPDFEATGHGGVDLLHRLGTARPVPAGVLTVDGFGPSLEAEPAERGRSVPLARALVTLLSGDGAGDVERFVVRGRPTVTVTREALDRPAHTDAMLRLAERLPGISEAVIGERTRMRVSARSEDAVDEACRRARSALGDRTEVELSADYGAPPETTARPC